MFDLDKVSVRSLWKVSYPMMVSFFSTMFMIFIDRLFLSMYSTESLNAVVQSGTLAWSFLLFFITLASMSEVFVAQYNGAKRFKDIGAPVWQMIWLSVGSLLFYLPFAYFGAPLIYNPEVKLQECQYLSTILYFGPFFAMVPAIGGFFVGRGKTQIIQWMAILGNLVNTVLDPILIFGIDGIIPSYGIFGAAVATGFGNIIQVVILFYLFYKKKNQEDFGTNRVRFDWQVFIRTIRVGLSPAVFVCLEVGAWAIFYHMMADLSETHIFIASVVQSVIILFLFFGMGLEKGVIALSGNCLGANKSDKVKEVLYAGIKIIGGYAIASSLLLIFFPNILINWFMTNPETAASTSLNMVEIRHMIAVGMVFSFFHILFENFRWILNGILTAAGDTLFLLIAGALSIWLFMLLPTYFFVVLPKADIFYAFIIWLVYSVLSASLVYFRFLQGKWKTKNIIEKNADIKEV